MKIAKSVAETSPCRWRLGAVLVKSGNVMAFATNSVKHDPRFTQAYTNHSEHNVIRLASPCPGATIYVARVGAYNDLKMAKPCNKCIKECFNARISKVVWSTAKGSFESSRLRELSHNANYKVFVNIF